MVLILRLSFCFAYEIIISSDRNKIRIKSLKLFLLLILINIKVHLVYFILSQSFILKQKTKQKLNKIATSILSSSRFYSYEKRRSNTPHLFEIA